MKIFYAILIVLFGFEFPAIAQQNSIEFVQSERAFEALPLESRITLQILLTASGYWPAVPNANYNKRLYEAFIHFQADHGYRATGFLNDIEEKKLFQEAWPLLTTWGFRSIAHPTRGHPIWIPLGLNLHAESVTSGVRWQDPDNQINLIYSYKPNRSVEVGFRAAIDAFRKYAATINYSVIRPDFYAISASGADGVDSYTRYHKDGDGILGFFLTWRRDALLGLHMERVAVLISGSLGASMTGAPFVEPPNFTSSQQTVPTSPVMQPPTLPPAQKEEKPKVHESSSGTGIFVTTHGDVLTNAHVVSDCTSIIVTSSDRVSAAGNIIARDQTNDLALIRSGIEPAKVATFRTSVRLGENVAVYGYPLANVLSSSGNFTLGNVTALAGLGDDSRYLQISAPVQPGNSGGPLFDQNGNVIGVVTAKLNALKVMIATQGDIAQNVNFAIKGSVAASFLESNGIKFDSNIADVVMQPPDLADKARLTSAFVRCF